MRTPTGREFEAASLGAWPALESIRIGDWVLRFSAGFTRRANSVQTGRGAGPGTELKRALLACEEEYRGRGLRPIFKIVPWTEPISLDRKLAARGYGAEGEVCVRAVRAVDLLGGRAAKRGLKISADVDESWVEAMTGFYPRLLGHKRIFEKIIDRIQGPRALATIRRNGVAVAGGMAVLGGALVGLFDLATDERMRRQGLGRDLVQGLAAWGAAGGARWAYLQVVDRAANVSTLQIGYADGVAASELRRNLDGMLEQRCGLHRGWGQRNPRSR